jgi:K+:H+ antiporter subunit KhtT
MGEVTETRLPGVGVRHEFTTSDGERVSVLVHRGGRRELSIADRRDPDAAATVLHLSPEDARTLVELLGATQVSEALGEVQQRIEGLAIEWLEVREGSSFVGSTIAEGAFRSRTGASIVAVVRGDTSVPAPEPSFAFAVGDVVVAVGTPAGLAQVRDLLRS